METLRQCIPGAARESTSAECRNPAGRKHYPESMHDETERNICEGFRYLSIGIFDYILSSKFLFHPCNGPDGHPMPVPRRPLSGPFLPDS